MMRLGPLPWAASLLLSPALLLTSSAVAAGALDRPTVGAIRWDAWSGGEVTAQVERTLGPARYHDRLPWFTEVVGPDQVRIDGGRQEVMDREITFAAAAGLDYWAFLLYPEASSMSVALGQYLASGSRDQIGFCLILHNTLGVSEADWPHERDRALALLREPGYQTVLGGRPLVYCFRPMQAGSAPARRFAEFLAAARAAGLEPYCVFMGWNPPADHAAAAPLGFAAVSHYACGSADATFAELTARVERSFWARAVEARAPYVPLVTTGWDKRPRKDNPVSWERDHGYHQQAVFPSQATPAEIAAHLAAALRFVRAQADLCAADTVIIYAWNEYDEGGWLAPTRGPDGAPDTSRLDAIAQVLRAPGE